MSQLQNSPSQQNRPFEPFCRATAEFHSPEYVLGGGVRSALQPRQTDSKSSIFLGRGVLQLTRMIRKLLASAALLCALTLSAEEQKRDYKYWDFHPLHAGATSIFLGTANLTENHYKGNLVFNKVSSFVYLLTPINEKNYFIPRVEYTTFKMDWNKNPKFNSTRFNYVQFALTYYTNALDKWRWIMRADYNMDTKHFGNNRYNLFSALLWGAYEIWKDWHYHVGAYGYTGMEGSQIYPVIGFDYTYDKWLFLIVFPLDYKVEYKLDKNWTFSLRARPLKERFRTGTHQPQPESVFNYSTIGTELNVRYEIFLRLEAEIYGGWNFGGNFYVKNRHGKNALYTDVESAPYGGASLNIGF
ncbi:MAG: hypothetical protein JSS32_09270 [Verrucomicrobia bacterium]|nr:hypothetical protein [Verrucomicrobiota bacterium]